MEIYNHQTQMGNFQEVKEAWQEVRVCGGDYSSSAGPNVSCSRLQKTRIVNCVSIVFAQLFQVMDEESCINFMDVRIYQV